MQTVVRTLLRATVYQLVRRLGYRYLVLGAAAALVILAGTEQARAATCALYGSQSGSNGWTGAHEVGSGFTVSGEGASVVAARYYRASTETGTHTIRIWDAAGPTELGSELVTPDADEPGWKNVSFDPPIALADGGSYVVSVNTNTQAYESGSGSPDTACGPITPQANFGRYNSTSGSYPATTDPDYHWFVDVTVDYETEAPPVEGDAAALTWWGIWALVGVSFAQLIAPSFLSVLRVTRGM